MKSGVKMDEGSRLLKVYETWRRTRFDPIKFSWRRGSGFQALRSLVALLLAILLSPIDANLWGYRGAPFAFAFLDIFHWTVPAAVILTGSIFYTWHLNRLLSRKTLDERSFRRDILLLRRIFSGLPILNFLVFPLWEWLVSNRPRWALRQATAGNMTPLPRHGDAAFSQTLPLPFASEFPGPRKFIFFAMACNMSSLIALCNLYSRLHPTSLPRFAILGISSLCFHLLAFFCILRDIWAEAQAARMTRWRFLAFSGLSSLWLPPIPWLPFGAFLLQVPLLPSTSQEKTLVNQSFRKRTDLEQSHSWSELKNALRRRWKSLPWRKRWRRPPATSGFEEAEAGKTLSRRLALHDLKAFLLLPDMTALVLILMPSQGHDLFREIVFKAILGCAVLGAGICFLVGIAVNTIRWISALLPSAASPPNLDRPLYGYLLTVPATFFIGLWAALVVRYGKPDAMRPAIEAISVVFLWLQMPYLFLGDRWLRNLGPKRGVMALLLRLLTFQTAVVISAQLAMVSRWGVERKASLYWLILSFLISLLCGGMLLPWLLKPYRWSLIRTGPWPTRIVIIFLGITTAMPLGGTAIPLWIVVRRQWWPRNQS